MLTVMLLHGAIQILEVFQNISLRSVDNSMKTTSDSFSPTYHSAFE